MRRVLIASLALNLVGAALAVRALYLRGSWEYVRNRLTGADVRRDVNMDAASYVHRQTLFERLPVHGRPIVFLGDSLTAGCEWGEFYVGALNRGIGGDTSAGVIDRLSTITQYHPRAIFLMIGINDLVNLKATPAQTATNIGTILSRIRQASPDTAIFLESLLPRGDTRGAIFAREVNQRIRLLADGKTVTYIDLYPAFLDRTVLNPKFTSDGGHLNGEGYELWKKMIDPYIQPYLSGPRS